MIESVPAVATSAMFGMSSIASLPFALPSAMPFESRRAATRCAGDMPSPMNRMTFLALRGRRSEDRPGYLVRLGAIAGAYTVGARSRQRYVAQDQRRLVLAVFALDERGGLAKDLGVVLVVEGDRDLGRIGEGGKFHFQIEAGADEYFGPVDRVDGLGLGLRRGKHQPKPCCSNDNGAHEGPPKGQSAPYEATMTVMLRRGGNAAVNEPQSAARQSLSRPDHRSSCGSIVIDQRSLPPTSLSVTVITSVEPSIVT